MLSVFFRLSPKLLQVFVLMAFPLLVHAFGGALSVKSPFYYCVKKFDHGQIAVKIDLNKGVFNYAQSRDGQASPVLYVSGYLNCSRGVARVYCETFNENRNSQKPTWVWANLTGKKRKQKIFVSPYAAINLDAADSKSFTSAVFQPETEGPFLKISSQNGFLKSFAELTSDRLVTGLVFKDIRGSDYVVRGPRPKIEFNFDRDFELVESSLLVTVESNEWLERYQESFRGQDRNFSCEHLGDENKSREKILELKQLPQ